MQIVDILLDRLVAHLTRTLINDVVTSDASRADVVKKGLLTESKTQKKIQVAVQGGDHELPDQIDGIASLDKLPDINMRIPAREVGGGVIWMRLGVVRLEAYLLHMSVDETRAHEIAYRSLGRTMRQIGEASTADLPADEFDERVVSPFYVYANTFFQSGGPPSSYIFRGKIMWAVFTERPS